MKHTFALIEKMHEGDKEAREQLIKENMGLVYAAVRRFNGRGYEQEDLVQIGSIGLIKAIDHFNMEFDVRFSTYAVPVIIGEIKRFIRDDGMIRVSRMMKECAARAYKIQEEYFRKNGTEPTIGEIAEASGISAEELVMAMEAMADVESLSQTVFSGDGTPVLLGDRIPDQTDQNEKLLNRLLLSQLLQILTEEEQDIIRMRYFEDMTQVQIAERLGMTQVQVSRNEKRILKKLRKEAG